MNKARLIITAITIEKLTLYAPSDYQRQKYKNTLKRWVQRVLMSCDIAQSG